MNSSQHKSMPVVNKFNFIFFFIVAANCFVSQIFPVKCQKNIVSANEDVLFSSVSDPDGSVFFADPDPEFKNPGPSVFCFNCFVTN